MIPVSDACLVAINADQRFIQPKIEVYFDGDNQPPITFGEDDITGIYLLEEACAESDNPLGLVSANEITIGFDNSARIFTPTNQGSPYYGKYGKLRPNILIKVWLGIEISSNTFEYIPLGVFRTGDWTAPSSTVEAVVTCYDRLYEIGQKDAPMLPVVADTTIYAMFEMLFFALGLGTGDYIIDTSLNQKINLGWLPNSNVQDALQVLAVAGNCSVATDRYGRIIVRSNLTGGSPVAALTDNDQIINSENPQRYLDTYSAVKVSYKMPYIKEVESLLTVENLEIPPGETVLQDVEFTVGPVVSIDQVRLLGATNSSITNVKFGAWSITIQITNTGASETVTLEVTGRAVDEIASTYTAQDSEAVAIFGQKELKIDNSLIQSLGVAKQYATALLKYISDPYALFDLEVRGNPALEIGDTVTIEDNINKIGTVNVTPFRFEIEYDGALRAKIGARRLGW